MASFRSERLEGHLIDLLEDTEPRALGLAPRVHDAPLFLCVPERSEVRARGLGGAHDARTSVIASRPPAFSRPTGSAALHIASVPEARRPFVRTGLHRERNEVHAAVRDALTLVAGVRS
jgi:hypothetical protein